MTNEERFLASCEKVGETGVQQMLNAGRYEGRKAEWATNWLVSVDHGKTDVTRAEERSIVTRKLAGCHRNAILFAIALAVLIGVLLLLFLR
jgi:hypothetical protein